MITIIRICWVYRTHWLANGLYAIHIWPCPNFQMMLDIIKCYYSREVIFYDIKL